MTKISPITKMLENKNLATVAAGAAGTVYITTGIKASVRPVVTYNDKNSSPSMRKYAAAKEFLYQVICLGVALSIVPYFRKGGYLTAKRALKKLTNENDVNALKEKVIATIKERGEKKKWDANKIAKKVEEINNAKIGEIKKDTKFDGFFKALKTTKVSSDTQKILERVHGGEIFGEFVGSILGLTILSPLLSMKVLHPILKACGLEEEKKAPAEAQKINKNA